MTSPPPAAGQAEPAAPAAAPQDEQQQQQQTDPTATASGFADAGSSLPLAQAWSASAAHSPPAQANSSMGAAQASQLAPTSAHQPDPTAANPILASLAQLLSFTRDPMLARAMMLQLMAAGPTLMTDPQQLTAVLSNLADMLLQTSAQPSSTQATMPGQQPTVSMPRQQPSAGDSGHARAQASSSAGGAGRPGGLDVNKMHRHPGHRGSMSQAEAAPQATSPLVQLPDNALSAIFEQLTDGDRRSLMHTCKALHNSDACLSKITTMTLKLDQRRYGNLHTQLTTIIPGRTISRMVVENYLIYAIPSDNSDRSDDPEEDAQWIPADMAYTLLAALPQHTQLLSNITHLTFNEHCSFDYIYGATELGRCFNQCLPNLQHLVVQCFPDDDESGAAFLSTLQHPLNSLHLSCWSRGYGSENTLGPRACASLGKLTSLEHLTLKARILSFRPLSNLSNLRALHVPVKYQAPTFARSYSDLNVFLAHCPHLTELKICELRPSSSWPPASRSLQKVELANCKLAQLPTLRTLPSLSHLHVDHFKYYAGDDAPQAARALQELRGVAFSGKSMDFMTGNRCETMRSCDGLQHVLSSGACVPAGLHRVGFYRIRLLPQQVIEFAGRLPEVQFVVLDACSFDPEALFVECVQGFSGLSAIGIVPSKQLKPNDVSTFCDSVLGACSSASVQAALAMKGHRLTVRFFNKYEGYQEHQDEIVRRMHRVWKERAAPSSSRVELEEW